MPLSFELHLDERKDDRVFVSVVLDPDGETRPIEGVALELLCPLKSGLGPRLLLPISGCLQGPLKTQAELRSNYGIPQGATVVGTVWYGDEQQVTQLPTDPCTGFESHVRGCPRVAMVRDEREFEPLTAAQQRLLRGAMPWLSEPVEVVPTPVAEPVTEDDVDDICASLGLDGECAEWLKDLMAEDE